MKDKISISVVCTEEWRGLERTVCRIGNWEGGMKKKEVCILVINVSLKF
jgi:hypothetical protein